MGRQDKHRRRKIVGIGFIVGALFVAGGALWSSCGSPFGSSTTPSISSSTLQPSSSPGSSTLSPSSCASIPSYIGPAAYIRDLTSGCHEGGVAWATDNFFTTPWETFHHSGAFNLAGPNVTVRNTIVVNFGDSFRSRDGSEGFLYDHVLGLFGHDDCFENDHYQAGVITDSICTSYVGISERWSGSGEINASAKTLTVRNSYIELFPTPTVYKGPAPGTGGWFKLGATPPKLVLDHNTFVASLIPNHQDLNPPTALRSCIGNKIVWKGDGSSSRSPLDFPARAAWLAACPDTVITRG